MVHGSKGTNHTSVILGDILQMHNDVRPLFVIEPYTWIIAVPREGNAQYTLLNVITKPG